MSPPFNRPPGDEAERLHHARVLWCSLYGISSLAASNSLHPTESATGLVDTLISHYVAELRRRRRTRQAGDRAEGEGTQGPAIDRKGARPHPAGIMKRSMSY